MPHAARPHAAPRRRTRRDSSPTPAAGTYLARAGPWRNGGPLPRRGACGATGERRSGSPAQPRRPRAHPHDARDATRPPAAPRTSRRRRRAVRRRRRAPRRAPRARCAVRAWPRLWFRGAGGVEASYRASEAGPRARRTLGLARRPPGRLPRQRAWGWLRRTPPSGVPSPCAHHPPPPQRITPPATCRPPLPPSRRLRVVTLSCPRRRRAGAPRAPPGGVRPHRGGAAPGGWGQMGGALLQRRRSLARLYTAGFGRRGGAQWGAEGTARAGAGACRERPGRQRGARSCWQGG
jgi:hypothetical protein